jgi:stage II sporulation protein D
MRLSCLLLAACLLCCAPAWAAETVRIAVAENQATVDLSGSHLERGEWGEEDGFVPLKKDKLSVSVQGGKLVIAGKVVGESVRLRASGLIKLKGFALRGTVDLKATEGGILVVNAIPLEDYLAAVLGGEMPPQFPAEALKAQAVAARTYAVSRKIDMYGKPYHLGATVLSQVYGGANREDPRTRAAVDATAGEVLTYDMQPIEAYFHASCGGQTESGRTALGRDLPYLKAVDCPCGHDPSTHWTLSLTETQLKKVKLDTEKLKVRTRSQTGRAVSLGDGKRTVDAVTFRQVLGYDQVKSLWFSVTSSGDDDGTVKLTGRGLGHGAGMCQFGSRMLAEDGWDYLQILAHFYPGAELQKMY